MICPKCGNEIAEGHLYCEVYVYAQNGVHKVVKLSVTK